jgi:hypothetical protein
MSRKTKIQKKRRLKQILNGDYETLDINENYMIATSDYDFKQLKGTIKDASEKPPLWDWFTLVNKKKNKIWYLDFSAPYVWNEFFDQNIESQKKYISNIWSINDIPVEIKWNPIRGGMYSLDDKDSNYDSKLEEKTQFYIKHNDWNKTFNDFKQKNEFNLKWDEGIKIFRNDSSSDWGIIIPHSYIDKTFVDVFSESIKLFNDCKFNQKYYELIEEIKFNKYIK